MFFLTHFVYIVSCPSCRTVSPISPSAARSRDRRCRRRPRPLRRRRQQLLWLLVRKLTRRCRRACRLCRCRHRPRLSSGPGWRKRRPALAGCSSAANSPRDPTDSPTATRCCCTSRTIRSRVTRWASRPAPTSVWKSWVRPSVMRHSAVPQGWQIFLTWRTFFFEPLNYEKYHARCKSHNM